MLHFSDRPISTGYGWAPRQAVETSVIIRHVDSYIQWDRIRYCGWASEILQHQEDGWNLIENGNHLSTAGFRWPIHRIIGRCGTLVRWSGGETLGAVWSQDFPLTQTSRLFTIIPCFRCEKKNIKKRSMLHDVTKGRLSSSLLKNRW